MHDLKYYYHDFYFFFPIYIKETSLLIPTKFFFNKKINNVMLLFKIKKICYSPRKIRILISTFVIVVKCCSYIYIRIIN